MNPKQLQPVLCILGPTGVGKTALSIQIAKALTGEIVSADSMQIYKGMDIGTAKVSKEEQLIIPHHCIDLVTIHEPYSVARYQEDARRAISEIHHRGHLPVVVGGTGLYIQAALEPYDFHSANRDDTLRNQLLKQYEVIGANAMWHKLLEVDKDSAHKLHPNDARRVIRALEAYQQSGIPLSQAEKRTKEASPLYRVTYIGFLRDREEMYERIDRRVDEMIREGLLQEVHQLIEDGLLEDSTPGQALGYKEFFPYFRLERSLEETVEQLKRDTRRYAKRQLTWFRRMRDIYWIHPDEYHRREKFEDLMERIKPLIS